MTWATILFAGWLTLAWLPSGGLELYDNPMPELVELRGSFYTELGGEATWGLLFAGGCHQDADLESRRCNELLADASRVHGGYGREVEGCAARLDTYLLASGSPAHGAVAVGRATGDAAVGRCLRRDLFHHREEAVRVERF